MYCSANDTFSGVAILKGIYGLLRLLITDNVSLIAENDCALRFLLRKAGVEPVTPVLTSSRAVVKSEWSVAPARGEARTCSEQLLTSWLVNMWTMCIKLL